MPSARVIFLVACLITMCGLNAWSQNNTLHTAPTVSTSATSASQQPPVLIAASSPTPKEKMPVVQSLETHAPFRVGVFNMAPFAFRSGGGQWSGLAVTLFQHIANSSGLRYSITEFENMDQVINAVENNTIDFAAIAVDPTPEFELTMNFTNAFELSGTSIAIAKHTHLPLLNLIESIWQSIIPRFVGVVLFSLIIFGVIVGLVERKKNTTQFGGGFWSTIGEGVWWSSATISTVGYGDRVPKTKRGRFAGGLWMLVAFALTSLLAGLLSSVLTVARINSEIHTPTDLLRLKCGALLNSAAFVDGKNMKYNMTPYATIDDCLRALERGQIGAALGESVRLRWLMNQSEWESLIMLPSPIVTLYSVFPVSSEVDPQTLDVINYHLLKITDSKEWEDMRHLFLGDQS